MYTSNDFELERFEIGSEYDFEGDCITLILSASLEIRKEINNDIPARDELSEDSECSVEIVIETWGLEEIEQVVCFYTYGDEKEWNGGNMLDKKVVQDLVVKGIRDFGKMPGIYEDQELCGVLTEESFLEMFDAFDYDD